MIDGNGNGNGERILLVDDDDVLRNRMGRAFDERGFVALLAQDYTSALALAAEHSPGFIVVDYRMPGRSGLELVRALRRMDGSSKIVVLTGYGSIATAVDAVRLGATHFLAKPADIDDILQAFRRPQTPPLTAQAETPTPSLARAEWEHINRVLSDSGANISEAARRLGIHRRSLQRKLQKYPPHI